MSALVVFAADNPFSRPEIIYGGAALVGAMLVGAIAIAVADKWRKRAMTPMRDDANELSHFRDMYEHGELTEEEYNELRRRVADKVKSAPTVLPEPPPDPSGRPSLAKLAKPNLPKPNAKPQPPESSNDSPESPPSTGAV